MNSLTNMAKDAGAHLKARGDTIAVAESSTGGLISAALLAVPGASAFYQGGTVIYTLEARRKILGLRRADVEGLEPLTEAMVLKFAQVARKQLDTTWAIAELGVAGPTGARYGHAPGLSVIAVDGPTPLCTTVETGSSAREANMWTFTNHAIALLEQALVQT